MAYIGRGLDKISNVEVLDNLTFDGSSTSFTLQKNSVNFTPSSANNILVSIDGVVQAGNFTCSGSTIDFGVAVSASSTCDFIIHYGVGVVTTPSDNSVTAAKIPNGTVSNAHLAGSIDLTSKVTGTLPIANGGIGATTLSGAGLANTPAFYAYLSADQSITHATVTKAQFNTELFDTDNCYDNSTNYRFTPTTAGKYALQAGVIFESVDDAKQGVMYFYKNGTNVGLTRMTNAKTGNFIGLTNTIIVDANGTSDYFEVNVYHDHGSNINISGNTGDPRTYFSGYKLIGV